MDYSLLMMVVMVVMSDRLKKRPGATPAVFPPPIAGTASVSPPPPQGNASGGLYIVVLGQDEHSRMKMDDIGGPRTKRTWVARLG
jgi:hypothetical protein